MIEIGFGVNKREKDVFFSLKMLERNTWKWGKHYATRQAHAEIEKRTSHEIIMQLGWSPRKSCLYTKDLDIKYDRFKRWLIQKGMQQMTHKEIRQSDHLKISYRGAGYCGHQPESQWRGLFDATDLLLWCSSLSRIWYRTQTKSGKFWLKIHYHVS